MRDKFREAEEAQRDASRVRAMLCRPSLAMNVASEGHTTDSGGRLDVRTPFTTGKLDTLPYNLATPSQDLAWNADPRLVRTASKSCNTGKRIWRPAGGKSAILHKSVQHFAD